MKILIVDDSNAIRAIIRMILKDLGHTDVEEADSGKAVLDMCKQCGEHAKPMYHALIVSDIEMPFINGPEFVKEIRKHKCTCKIIALSTTRNKDRIIEMLKAGADGYIFKDLNPAHLREKIAELVGSSSG